MRQQPFSGAPTYEFEQRLLGKMRATIGATQIANELQDERLLERTIAEFVEQNRLWEPAISVPLDGLQPSSTTEHFVQNDGRFSRLGMPFVQKMLDLTFLIPISGNSDLLRLNPNTAPFGTGIVGKLVLLENQLSYVYTTDANASKEQLAQAIKNDLVSLRRHVEAIASWVQQWNAQLEARIRPAVVQRIAELQRNMSLTDGLRISF